MRFRNIIAVIAVAVLAGMLFMLPGCAPNAGGDNKPDRDITDNKPGDVIDDDKDGAVKEGQNGKDADNEGKTVPETPGKDGDAVPNLGGISLGDSAENAAKVLGNDYTESTEPDASGTIGEDMVIRQYKNGITVYLGKTSGKVLRIISESTDFETDIGIKVGDDAKAVSDAYKSRFKTAVSRHSDEELEGWYLLGDGAVIIFDFDKSDDTLTNSDINPESKVERIVLAYWQHFD
ncbi:MAG: hypothetical protein GXX04_08895 [Clostridiaceae bacterium]|nr:hypothetical protein [Clostridiaceae bacterium]